MTSSNADTAVGLGFLKLGAGEAVARIVAFTATAYLARQLGADAYGIVVLATSVMVYIGRLSDGGVDLLGVKDVAHDPARLPDLLPGYLGARLLLTIPLALLTAAAGLILLPRMEATIMATYALAMLPVALGTRWVHIGLGRPGVVSVARSLTECVAAGLIVSVVRTPLDVGRVPLALIAGESVGTLLLLRALPRSVRPLRVIFRWDVLVSLCRRSWPLVAHALLGLLIMNSDFFILRMYQDRSTVGYYAAAYALVGFFVNLGQSYQLSLLPVLARISGDTRRQAALCQTASAQVFVFTFPLALGGYLLADRLLPAVFGNGYVSSVDPLQVLIWSVPVALARNVVQGLLIARGRQDIMVRTSAWAAFGNVGLNLLIVPVWGMVGAATVTLVTEVLRLIPMLVLNREPGLPIFSLGRVWRPIVAGSAMAAVITTPGIPVWIMVMVGVLAYASALWLVGGLRFHRGSPPELVI